MINTQENTLVSRSQHGIETGTTNAPLRIICLLLCLITSGCSMLSQTQDKHAQTYFDWAKTETELLALEHWSLFGKLGFRSTQESVTAAINKWQQNGDAFEIDISSTFFGLGSSKLSGSAHFLKIEQSGEDPIGSFEPDTLIESSLGIPLPISHLQFWIKGLPANGIPYTRTFNTQGLVASLEQDNWSISYSHYDTSNNTPLPGKIKIRQNDIYIIVAVKEWILH